MRTIHLANIACGFHAGDFTIMRQTVDLAVTNNVLIGAHPSLPDRQGFGRREMSIGPVRPSCWGRAISYKPVKFVAGGTC